jgi:hypothetical protein
VRRGSRVLLVGLLNTMLAGMAHAQGIDAAPSARTRSPVMVHVSPRESASRTPDTSSLRRITDKWQPLRQRVPQDDRLRTVSALVGVAVLAYQGVPSRRKVPVAALGTHALRLGLHPQLNAVRERTGFTLEPSIGRREFVLTFRRTF